MKWTEEDGRWTSGPYTIELLGPEMWALSRESAESGDAIAVVDEWWTDRSLRAMMRMAESLEADKQRLRSRNRDLMVMLGALSISVLAANASGPAGSIVVVLAAAAALFGLIRTVERTFARRPWEFVSKNYQ